MTGRARSRSDDPVLSHFHHAVRDAYGERLGRVVPFDGALAAIAAAADCMACITVWLATASRGGDSVN